MTPEHTKIRLMTATERHRWRGEYLPEEGRWVFHRNLEQIRVLGLPLEEALVFVGWLNGGIAEPPTWLGEMQMILFRTMPLLEHPVHDIVVGAIREGSDWTKEDDLIASGRTLELLRAGRKDEI